MDRSVQLRERLAESEGRGPVTRGEALELVEIVEETLAQLSPERWDRIMETIVDEAARRAGALAIAK
ncbi:MAG: hypothetical protein MJB57_15285 [Gemmatimonadetes bacterium]|nr:hypothetical protein [Gemmatimonadota bacterium]